jgi:hypothetical protein
MQLAILLLVVVVQCAFGAQLPQVENPCTQDQLYSLRYYQPYKLSERQYIECTPWNGMEIRDCYAKSKWSTWLYRCSDEALERTLNSTLPPQTVQASVLPSAQPTWKPSEDISQIPIIVNITTCLYYGNDSCENQGVCNMFPTGGRCACLANTTGEYCQYKNVTVKTTGVFGQLINESFSLDTYRQNRPLLDEFYAAQNGSIDASQVQCNQTRARIAEYLAMYPNGTVRFDMLVNYLIQDYMTVIYPWQFFLQEFAYPSEMAMGYINAIPGLLMSSKYAYDKFDDFWSVLEDILQHLVKYLPEHLPNIRHEADLFFQIYDGFFRQFEKNGANMTTGMLTDEFSNASAVNVDMIKEKIRRDFNKTLSLSWDLFRTLGRFDEEIGVRASAGQINATYVQELVANFSISDNVTTLIAQVGESNAEIWDSTTFFAFWYVVSDFVSEDLLNAARNQSYLTNDTELQRIIRPSRPKGVFRANKFEQEGLPIFQALVDEREEERVVAKKPVNLHNGTHSKPKTEQLVSAFNVSQPLQLVGEEDSNAEKLVSAFNASLPQGLVGERINSSKAVKPKTEQLVSAFNVSQPLQLVGEEDSNAEKLVSAFNASLPQNLVGERINSSKAVKPKTEQLVSAFNASLPQSLVDEKNDSSKSFKDKIASAFNFSEPQHLIGNGSMLPEKLVSAPANVSEFRPIKLVSGDKPEKPVVDEKQIFPAKLVSAFAPVGEDKNIERPVKLVGDKKEVVVPEKLVVADDKDIVVRPEDKKIVRPLQLVGEEKNAEKLVADDKKIVRPPLKIVAGDEDFRHPAKSNVVN